METKGSPETEIERAEAVISERGQTKMDSLLLQYGLRIDETVMAEGELF